MPRTFLDAMQNGVRGIFLEIIVVQTGPNPVVGVTRAGPNIQNDLSFCIRKSTSVLTVTCHTLSPVLFGHLVLHIPVDHLVLTPAVAPALPCRLAALEACSGNPLTRLVLQGAVPLRGAVAEAIAACCPHLTNLVLNYRKLSGPSDAVPAKEAEAEYDHGCVQLLTLCGPRLRGLTLLGVPHWKALSYTALRSCTALKRLALHAGDHPADTCGCERYLGGDLGLASS